MQNNDLIQKIEKWKSTSKFQESLKKEKEALEILEKFKNDFNYENILEMDLKDYSIGGENSQESFCYKVEQQLDYFGRITGTPATKFIVYWQVKEKKYFFRKYKNQKENERFGNSLEEVFLNVKKYLKELMNPYNSNDYEKISKNPLTPVFKNKVWFLYNHDQQIPIFSEKKLDQTLSVFNINYDNSTKLENKREMLWNFYKKNSLDKLLTPSLFMCFVADEYWEKNQKLKNIQTLDENSKKEYSNTNNDRKNIKIQKIKTNNEDVQKFIIQEGYDLIYYIPTTNTERGSKIIKFDPEVEKQKKIIGNNAEEIVGYYLENNKEELDILKIERWSSGENQDDRKGYDFSYVKNDGSEVFIEVKGTKINLGNKVQFEMSKKEFSVMTNNKDNYFIYFVDSVPDYEPYSVRDDKEQRIIKKISANELDDGVPSKISFKLIKKD